MAEISGEVSRDKNPWMKWIWWTEYYHQRCSNIDITSSDDHRDELSRCAGWSRHTWRNTGCSLFIQTTAIFRWKILPVKYFWNFSRSLKYEERFVKILRRNLKNVWRIALDPVSMKNEARWWKWRESRSWETTRSESNVRWRLILLKLLCYIYIKFDNLGTINLRTYTLLGSDQHLKYKSQGIQCEYSGMRGVRWKIIK